VGCGYGAGAEPVLFAVWQADGSEWGIYAVLGGFEVAGDGGVFVSKFNGTRILQRKNK
jgi:hypothetical protein